MNGPLNQFFNFSYQYFRFGERMILLNFIHFQFMVILVYSGTRVYFFIDFLHISKIVSLVFILGSSKRVYFTSSQKSKRKRNSIINSIKDIIEECPVCYSICRTRIVYQCNGGHFVCNQCYPKLTVKTCPTCRSEMFETRYDFT